MVFSRRDDPQVWLRVLGMVAVLLLGLYALSPGRAAVPTAKPLPMRLVPLEDIDGIAPALGVDNRSLPVRASAAHETRAELRFSLPPRTPESPQWVIWMPRVPVASVRLRAGEAWDSGPRSFLAPGPEEGAMPVGFLFRLPSTWEGDIQLELAATALRDTTLRPELLPDTLAEHETQRATILVTLAYASLLTVAGLMLALFVASRDLSFLSLFMFCLASTLLLLASNGHLYAVDPFGLFRRLGGAGLHLVSLVFEASSLVILLRYADTAQSRPKLAQGVHRAAVGLLPLAAAIAVWGRHGDAITAWLVPALWLGGCSVALYLMKDAWARRVPFSSLVTLSVVGMAAAAAAWELGAHGLLPDSLWVRYGHQVAMMVATAAISVGLISRISKYREQRDREQRARADSERRMYREAVRTELLTALQMALRGVSEEEIQPCWTICAGSSPRTTCWRCCAATTAATPWPRIPAPRSTRWRSASPRGCRPCASNWRSTSTCSSRSRAAARKCRWRSRPRSRCRCARRRGARWCSNATAPPCSIRTNCRSRANWRGSR